MKGIPRFTVCFLLTLAVSLYFAGGSSQHFAAIGGVHAAAAGTQYQAPPDQGPDPAAVNEAPPGPSYTTEAPPPPDQYPDDSGYADQPTATAPQPPPALPVYQQPPPPGDDYIWTPGFWAWGPNGYYWVPGAWVEPPYMGALWTPGYWGFYGGRYMFYPGHWGLHIGFYGGINYGFGYLGVGYEGGYWRANHFFYNRVYNNINVRVVHNVYNYRANVRAENAPRTSYRGGPGGVDARPRESEARAWHEATAPRMSSQTQHVRNYSAVRGQYASQNHGRPPSPAISRPLPADRNVQPTQRWQHQGGQNRGRQSGGKGQPDRHR
jgi:WXXGXW repeat (2 copies)